MNQHISFGTTYNARVNIDRQGNEQHLIQQVRKMAEESLILFPTGCSAITQVFRQTEPEKYIQVSRQRNRQSA